MRVEVLMSTYNGERFMMEQLQSIYAQKGVETEVLVRDDGSTDKTPQMLETECQEGRLRWYAGENLKPARSFMDLLKRAGEADLYAFSDHDDVWMDDKLEAAAQQIGNADGPALYFCQTLLVDENLKPLKQIPIHPLLTYGEALASQFIGGCTMVFNNALRQIVNEYVPSYLRMHDIWIYDIALAVGARVVFDPNPHIYYRQHGNNAVGQTASKTSQWKERFWRFYESEHIRWRIARELLVGYGDKMTPENRKLTERVVNYRKNWGDKWYLISSPALKTASSTTRLTSRLALLTNKF